MLKVKWPKMMLQEEVDEVWERVKDNYPADFISDKEWVRLKEKNISKFKREGKLIVI